MLADYSWRAFAGLERAVRSGTTPVEDVHGMQNFDYYQRHPAEQRLFASTQSSISARQSSLIAEAYPFEVFQTVVDVSGARGYLLEHLLRCNRH